MAETLSPSRLRQLAEVQPEQGRVLSVFMDLDPSEFGTPPARASQITSLVTDARHRVDELDDLSHDEQKALRADVETVRDVLSQPGIADDGARGVAVFACSPAGLLETVRVPHPLAQKVVIDRTPYVDPLLHCPRRRPLVRAARQPAQRALLPGHSRRSSRRPTASRTTSTRSTARAAGRSRATSARSRRTCETTSSTSPRWRSTV